MNDVEIKLQMYGDLLIDAPLSAHTTFRIGGKAKYFLYPKSTLGLMRVLDIAKENELEVRIFGKGSNILASDEDYKGLILCLDRYFSDFYFETDGTCIAQSGTSIILLAHEAMKRELSGLEFASGIPGTIGGAVFMNAGAYKSEIRDIIDKVFVLKENNCCWLSVDELAMSYRSSIFQKQRDWIILAVKLKLSKGNGQEIRDLMDSRRQRRIASQPLNLPSAGSIFRNPDQLPAWKCIEEVGLRGYQIGGAMVSDKHANFIVNVEHASAKDVIELIALIQQKVKDKYQIDLKTEVEHFNWPKEK